MNDLAKQFEDIPEKYSEIVLILKDIKHLTEKYREDAELVEILERTTESFLQVFDEMKADQENYRWATLHAQESSRSSLARNERKA